MLKKAAAAMGIFVMLFSGAWALDYYGNQEPKANYVENQPGMINVTNTTQLGKELVRPILKFHPREYVRITD